MAEGTLSPNSRELEDSEVAEITEFAPEGHGIAQDVDDIPDTDHVPSSVVDEEEPPSNKRGSQHPLHPCLRTKARAVLGQCPRTA
jgi:hypothetical protein